MSTPTLAAPIRVNTTSVHARPGLGRLVAVELRKMVNTRAGFWLQIATVAITALVVVARSSLKYCLTSVCLYSTCRLGAIPVVRTRVR